MKFCKNCGEGCIQTMVLCASCGSRDFTNKNSAQIKTTKISQIKSSHSNQNMPKEFKSFLQMIEGLKNDEGALQTLKEEILNHYGE